MQEGWAAEAKPGGATAGAAAAKAAPTADATATRGAGMQQLCLWGGLYTKPSAAMSRAFEAEAMREARRRASAKSVGAYMRASELAPLLVAALQSRLSRCIDLFHQWDEDG